MSVNRHMLLCRALLLVIALSSVASRDADLQAQAAPLSPDYRGDADGIMVTVRSNLPDAPIVIRGRLLAAERLGRPEPVCMVELALSLGDDPPVARYSIMNLFGEIVEEMILARPPGSGPAITYRGGDPSSPAPGMRDPIRGTDITWNDLTLSFLWWRGGRVAGRESIRGRDCIIVEFDDSVSTRLWIDDRLFMIIQAEEYDSKGTRTRRLSVKNIKKIGDVWMLKDLEVRSYPSMRRTLLRVDEVIRDGEAIETVDD